MKTQNTQRSFMLSLLSVMLCFFVMGFVDLVGTASNYVQKDLGLTDSQANLFPSLVFFWFLIFSVPTGMLMNKIGRKNTVLLSMVITIVSLFLPFFGDNYFIMLSAFSLLGIGNAILQTSLNPLVSNLINGDMLASTLTFGQFMKAIASFLAPIIAAWGATGVLPVFGLGWRGLFIIYGVVCVLCTLFLAVTPIKEERQDKASSVMDCVRLLGRPFILLSFIGIMCHVGIDVGTNATAPKVIMEKLGLPLVEAGFATSVYFIFRTIGSFCGAFLLRFIKPKAFFAISLVLMLAGMVILIVGSTQAVLYAGIGLIGFGNSNVFSLVFSQALLAAPDDKNEVSGLMIMGLFGGTIFPIAMGYAADATSQAGAVAVMIIGVVYLAYYTLNIKKSN